MKDNLTGNEGGGTAIAHVPSLDGVRGIAILLVLAHHFGVPADLPHRSASVFTQWIERLLYVGWAGVDLFFVLSGFLITSILLVSKNAPEYFRRFYSRRILRIFPLYYFTLILGLVVLPRLLTYQNVGLLRDVTSGQAWLWTYTLNIGLALGWVTGPAIFGHYWTLAVEEQYYLIWPWVVKVASSRTILILSGLMLFAALVLRIIWFDSEFGWAGAYRFTLTRADSLALGGAIAVLTLNTTFRSRLLNLAPFGLIGGICVIGLMLLNVPQFYPSEWVVVTFGHSVLAFTSACLIGIALRYPTGPLANRYLRALGKYSYGIYVWHWPLQQILLGWYRVRPVEQSANALFDAFVFVTVGITGSVLLGWTSYQVIESPFLRLKRFFAYSRAISLQKSSSTQSAVAPST